MLPITISGMGNITFTDIIFDFNGTIAVSGDLISGVAEQIQLLSQALTIHIVTGDSYGKAKDQLKNLNCKVAIMPSENQGKTKMKYLNQLNADTTLMVGNGCNDQYVLKAARIGIVIIGKEGASVQAIMAADVVCHDIFDVFDILNNSKRLNSTLRA